MKTVYSDEQLDRITQRIEEYRATKLQQLLDRAMKLWRRDEADRRIAKLFESPERMH
jgi:hypothetical protein